MSILNEHLESVHILILPELYLLFRATDEHYQNLAEISVIDGPMSFAPFLVDFLRDPNETS